MRYVVFHRPPTNGVSHGAHYERLSPQVLRLDRTLGPHLHHHHRVLDWRWVAVGFALGVIAWIILGGIVWTVWRH